MAGMIDPILHELEHETSSTRRVLERVPADKLEWRPHERSFTLGQLALHVATLPGAIAEMASVDELAMPNIGVPQPASAEAIVTALTASVQKANEILAGFDDEALRRTWRLVSGDKEIMSVPRLALLRTFLLNHWYHHRAQLTVYLRLLDVPLPSVYGPTADENPFG